MKLSELKEQAKKILEIGNKEYGEFKNKSFLCNSGGAPTNKIGIPEVYRGETKKYPTVRNGWAYSGEVVILCKLTEAYDKNENGIFITPDDLVFVFEYHSGSPEYFDSGRISNPVV